MAEADLLDGGILLGDGPGVDGHRVDVLQHDRFGHTSSMSSQIDHKCGTVRMPRMMPPMPSVSAMVWRRPHFLGHLEIGDRARVVAADLEADDDEIGTVERLALVGEGFDFRRHAKRRDQLAGDHRALFEPLRVNIHQGRSSRRRARGRCSTSPTMFFMNTVEPAPMNVICGLAH